MRPHFFEFLFFHCRMFISSFWSTPLISVPVSFLSLSVPCAYSFVPLFIAFTFSCILWLYSTNSVRILITYFQEVQEAQRFPKKLDPRKHTPRNVIITLTKIKDRERILKVATEEETVTSKGVPIRLSADFSKETLQARRGWKVF